jgi:hypothetical protein
MIKRSSLNCIMKKSNFYLANQTMLKTSGALIGGLLCGCLLNLPASAQTSAAPADQSAPATTAPANTAQTAVANPAAALGTPSAAPAAPAPLNLDADDVAKEMSKEQHPADTKGTLTSTQNLFEQSILNSESRKKVTGMVEAGAGVGSLPAQRGFKSENFYCENTAVGINDEISKNAQIAVYAQVDNCKTR